MILLLALVVRLALVVAFPSLVAESTDTTKRYDRIAKSLIAGRGFAFGDRPTAEAPPVYPLLLAGLYTVFGRSLLALRSLQALLDAGVCATFFVLARRLFGRRVAWCCGIALVLCPYLIYAVYLAAADTPYLFLHGLFLLTLVRAAERPDAKRLLGAGLWLAAATLCRAVSLLLPLVVLPALLVVSPPARRRGARTAALFLVAFLVPTGLWTVRNAVRFGGFVPIQTVGGRQLLGGTFAFDKGALRAHERRTRRSSSPTETDRAAWVEGLRRIAREPATALRRVRRRLALMWYETTSHAFDPYLIAANAVLLSLAALGCVLSRRRWRRLLPLWLVTLYYVAVHSLLAATFRYMLPVVPILVLFASLAAVLAWESLRGDRATGRRLLEPSPDAAP